MLPSDQLPHWSTVQTVATMSPHVAIWSTSTLVYCTNSSYNESTCCHLVCLSFLPLKAVWEYFVKFLFVLSLHMAKKKNVYTQLLYLHIVFGSADLVNAVLLACIHTRFYLGWKVWFVSWSLSAFSAAIQRAIVSHEGLSVAIEPLTPYILPVKWQHRNVNCHCLKIDTSSVCILGCSLD